VSVKHLNQRQLAERWNVAEATLERWRSTGIGPVYLKLQGRVLYRVEDIEEYEAKSLHSSTSSRVVAGGVA
jgi:predicted site-specific integrase-resolvase